MRIIWIGSYASSDMLDKMTVKNIGQASGVTSQASLLYGLDKCFEKSDIVVDSLNVQGIPSYPVYPSKTLKSEIWSRNGKSTDISVGFNNRKIFKIFSREKNIKKSAKEWIKLHQSEEEIHVFLYEPVLYRLAAVKTIKKYHPNVKCHLIVPDIPEFVGNTQNKIMRILKGIRKKKVFSKLYLVDDYVFYAREMADYYGVSPDKFIVMEGSIDLREAENISQYSKKDIDEFVLMYSGAISFGRGLNKFMESFEKCKYHDLSLWFTGGGNYVDQLNELAKKDKRIVNHGFLSSREEVLKLQAEATALLHIRDKEAISSRFCFPSKLFEYMVSGKPVISVRIPGIPEEYYQYLIVIDDLSVESVSEAIDRVYSMSEEERNLFGAKAKAFVLENKNCVVQAKKMLKFINVQ